MAFLSGRRDNLENFCVPENNDDFDKATDAVLLVCHNSLNFYYNRLAYNRNSTVGHKVTKIE